MIDKAEIDRKVDEIVAFAVVAHLEPEILLMDEGAGGVGCAT